jgi:hypothetical protein
MANRYDYGYERGRYDRDYYDDAYYRSHGGHEEPYHRAYGGEPTYYDYRSREPYYRRYRRDYEGKYRAPYYRGSFKLGAEGLGPRGYQRSDERIYEDINDRLTDDGYVDATDIEVTVNNGTVTLTGRVDSRGEKRRAEDIAELVSGVTDVSNQLRVGPSVPITADATGASRARTAGT